MKILLINHYAGAPELGMEFRPYYMAKEWEKLGHETLIVGGSFSHLRRRQPSDDERVIDGVHYSWVKVNKYVGNGIGRIISMFLFIFKLFFRYRHYLGNFQPDIVIASSTYPMDIYPARKIARHYHAKLIYEVHDLWPLSPMELGGYSKNHPFIKVAQRAENYCYRYADAVISMLPAAEQHMIEHGLEKGKFNYMPNGIDLTEWNTSDDIDNPYAEDLQKFKDDGCFILCYAGGHAISNALDVLLDALKIIADTDIKCLLVGNGQEKLRLMKRVEQEGISNVFFYDPVPKSKIPSLLKSVDALYIGWHKSPLYQYGISPNKLLDYMMAGKPIIHSVCAANDWVKDAECGISVDVENPQAISDAIIALKNMPEIDRERLGENGRRYVLANHTYGVLAKRYADVMTNILKK